jgi:putative PIN family toxin of toxin-antitoxin system
VLDTNVLASGFVRTNPQSPPVQLLDAWRARLFTLVLSEHILAELEKTLAEPYFLTRLTPTQRSADLSLIREEATLSPITAPVHEIATHPEDDLILATAVSAKADYLVTGDTKLQDVGIYQGVSILSPRGFLAILQGETAEGDGN